MSINQQAVELNEKIKSANPGVFNLLSEKGRNIFFPKKGILGQTADADGCDINATIGTALEDDGAPMFLQSIARNISLKPKDVFLYSKSFGKPELRKQWKKMLEEKNPSLAGAAISLPIATSALTHGLSMAGYMFCNPGDKIILPDMFWGNYRLIFENAYGAQLDTFTTFTDDGRFNTAALAQKLQSTGTGKKIVLINAPNNPTGYTPTVEEAHAIKDALVAEAQKGSDIAVFIDDAYFGLVFEKGIIEESLFALLANAHERILAVKFDGPTKEDYVWGFRIGFITFGSQKNSSDMYAALEAKLAGAVRGNISNASHLSQSLLLAAYESSAYQDEKNQKFSILKRRYEKIRDILKSHPEYSAIFKALPFNSGYFMCVRLKGLDAEKVRQRLISHYSTGIIALGNCIRIAFSATPYSSLDKLFDNIYKAGRDVEAGA